jgi:hypothetical protein
MRKLLLVLLALTVAYTFLGCVEDTTSSYINGSDSDSNNDGSISSAAVGTWDRVDEDGEVLEEGYLVITNDDIEVSGFSISSGFGITVKSGQIYSTILDEDFYYYDYSIDGDIMYFISETTSSKTDPDEDSDGVLILKKQSATNSEEDNEDDDTSENDGDISSAAIGTWDWVEEDGDILDEGYLVVTKDDVKMDGTSITGGFGDLTVGDGQIYFTIMGDDYYLYDYSIDGKLMYLIFEETSTKTNPDEDTYNVLIFKKQLADNTEEEEEEEEKEEDDNTSENGNNISSSTIGTWDLVDEDGDVIDADYLVITKNDVEIDGTSLSGGYGDITVDDGQIYMNLFGDDYYFYDYSIDGKLMYLVADDSSDKTNPDEDSDGVMILAKQSSSNSGEDITESISDTSDIEVNITSDAIGTWDWVDEDGDIIEEEYLVVTKDDAEFSGYSLSMGLGDVTVEDGQISINFMGEDLYFYDFSIDGDSMYLVIEETSDKTDPDEDTEDAIILMRQ